MNKRKITLSLIAFLAACVAFALLSCGDDECPTCPGPPHEPDYHLLYSFVDPDFMSQYIVLTYSLKSGEVVDSTEYFTEPFRDVEFSADGEHTYYTREGLAGDPEIPNPATWVTDTRTGDTVAITYEHGGYGIDVSRDGALLVVSNANELALLRLPDLEVLYADSLGSETAAFDPVEDKVYFGRGHADSMFVMTYNSLGVVSIASHALTNRARTPVYPASMSPSPDGELLVLDVAIPYGIVFFQVLKTDDFSIIMEEHVPAWRAHAPHVWHPTDGRVFMPFNGGFDAPYIGGVDVYDVNTGVFQSYITADEVSIDPDFFVPSRIALTPEGDLMAILCGGNGYWTGPIVVLNVATKQVIDKLKPGTSGLSHEISIIPVDWEKEVMK